MWNTFPTQQKSMSQLIPFLNYLTFTETTRYEKVRFRWIEILCGLHNNLKRMEAVLFVLAYPIEDWIVNKTAYQSHLPLLLFMRYCTFKMHKASKKNFLRYFPKYSKYGLQSSSWGSGFSWNFCSKFFLVLFHICALLYYGYPTMNSYRSRSVDWGNLTFAGVYLSIFVRWRQTS